MNNPLLAAYRYTTNNWALICGSEWCGCCNCVQIFPADEIVGWTGLDAQDLDNPDAMDKQTAMCPKCGSEAVLGDKTGYPINVQFLSSMNEAWFQKTLIRAAVKPQAKDGAA